MHRSIFVSVTEAMGYCYGDLKIHGYCGGNGIGGITEKVRIKK